MATREPNDLTAARVRRGVSDAAAPLEAAVQEQMPGWRLAKKTGGISDAMGARTHRNAQSGVGIEALRKKFLRSPADVYRATEGQAQPAEPGASHVETFKVEPAEGGPSRVAQRRNGKISIISG